MGGRWCEGLSGVTRVSIRRGSVCVDLLYFFKAGTLSDSSVAAPGKESHSSISDSSCCGSKLTVFLEREMKKM